MVEKNLQTEILLELVFSASGENDEQFILNKSIPVYLRKLNCFQAGVLKKKGNRLQEKIIIPFVAGKSIDWNTVKDHFTSSQALQNESFNQYSFHGAFYYAFYLNNYGILILGRKKTFDETFLNELVPVINHLGKLLIQADEIKKRKQAEASLRESEQRFRTLSDTTTAGIFIFSDVNIDYANPAAEKLSGYNAGELTALNILDLVHPDFRKQILQLYLAKQSGEKKTMQRVIRIVRKDGEKRWVDITVGCINWKGHQANIISAFDITRHKQTETDLIKSKEKAEESDLLKSAFLANMSHEIRTPMNGILGFAQLLKRINLTGEQQQKYVSIIEKSGVRMLSIINDIINISKIESGQMEVFLTETNINEKLDELYAFFKPEVEKKGIHLLITDSLPADKATIHTDHEKLYAILINLVKNAIKFTNEGSIELGYLKKGNYLEFSVKDTGIGIPKDRHAEIFQRFIQVDLGEKRTSQGSGLGLSISLAYVEMLGGKIWIKSKPGKGSVFYFTIPYLMKN